jgi:L-fuconolactonase
MVIVDTHVHVFTEDRTNYPQISDTPRAGSIPSITEIGQTEWTLNTAEMLIAEMDDAGVAAGTITQAYFVYEYDNSYNIDSAKAHPDRLASIVVLDPMDPASPDELSRLVEEEGVSGLRFMRGRLPESSLGEAATFPLWERLSRLGLVVAVNDRLADIPKIRRAMERYPDVKVAFEHAWGHVVDLPPYPLLEPLWAFADNPNVYVKTAINNIDAAKKAGGTSEDLYTRLVDTFGAKRLMWSSNYPAHPRFGGLKERLEISQQELAFLGEEERRWIFGETALSLWPALRPAD